MLCLPQQNTGHSPSSPHGMMFQDWQDGLRALLPNINISFGQQPQHSSNTQRSKVLPDQQNHTFNRSSKCSSLGIHAIEQIKCSLGSHTLICQSTAYQIFLTPQPLTWYCILLDMSVVFLHPSSNLCKIFKNLLLLSELH